MGSTLGPLICEKLADGIPGIPSRENSCNRNLLQNQQDRSTFVVVKIIVPFWVLSIIRHLTFRGPKRGP